MTEEQTITITLTATEFHHMAAAVQGEVLPWKIAHPLVQRFQEAATARAAELASSAPVEPPAG